LKIKTNENNVLKEKIAALQETLQQFKLLANKI